MFIDFRLPLLTRGLVFVLYITPNNITVHTRDVFTMSMHCVCHGDNQVSIFPCKNLTFKRHVHNGFYMCVNLQIVRKAFLFHTRETVVLT